MDRTHEAATPKSQRPIVEETVHAVPFLPKSSPSSPDAAEDLAHEQKRQQALHTIANDLWKLSFSGNGSLTRVLPVGLPYYRYAVGKGARLTDGRWGDKIWQDEVAPPPLPTSYFKKLAGSGRVRGLDR